ncbi:MAG: PAS domain-containing protein [Paludibacter sp.]|nr:PAS domain-containing protein [Paludibacter sp.]
MKTSLFLSLLQNIAVMVTFTMLYDYLWARNSIFKNLLFKIIAGIVVGFIGIVLILTPWSLLDRLIFDSRSILLAVSGLFLGPIPTIIAIIITSLYRILLGGAGLYMGVTVIVLSGVIGILWGHFRPRWQKKSIPELLSLGFVVHLMMMVCILMLPDHLRAATFQDTFLPLITVYPLATLMVGLLMIHQEQNWKNRLALNDSEKRWHFAIDGAGDGLWDWNPQTNEVFFSHQLKRNLGYEEEEYPNHINEWERRVHPDDKEKVDKTVDMFLKNEISFYEIEYRLQCKDGSYKWILDRGKTMSWDKDMHPIRCIGTHTDITQRKNIEQAIKESEQYTSSILSAIPDLIFVLDNNKTIIDFKSGDKKNLIIPAEEFLNKPIDELLPQNILPLVKKSIAAVFENKKPNLIEYKLKLNKDLNFFECNMVPFGETKVIAMIRNITQRKQIEESLIKSEVQLKSYAAHLQNIREEERILLAREIHDELGQILVAIKIDLGLLSLKANQHFEKNTSVDFTTQLEHLADLVDKTIKTTRRIMTDLRPEILDVLGIKDALKQHLTKFAERNELKCTFEDKSSFFELDAQQSLTLFRILQESLTNIVKHAKASEVKVKLLQTNDSLQLTISDNGIGFNSQSAAKMESYGLIGMKERAFLINGNLTVTSKKNAGTTIKIEIPYSITTNKANNKE